MKFLILCAVAMIAPQVLDNGSGPEPRPLFYQNLPAPAEEAPAAVQPDPEYDAKMRRRPRADRRGDPQTTRIRKWMQERKFERQLRRFDRKQRREHPEDVADDVDKRRPGPRAWLKSRRRLLDPTQPAPEPLPCRLDR